MLVTVRRYQKASIRIRENLVDLTIEVIVEKNTNPCFVAAAAAEKRFISSLTSPDISSFLRTMDLLQHINRFLFHSQPVKHIFSFGIVSQSPDIEGNYFQICCIVSNEGGRPHAFKLLLMRYIPMPWRQ